MKVKIEFEVNAPTSKLLKCLYDRLDVLNNDLINMDSNFKDIDVVIIAHYNKIVGDNPHIDFHNSFYGLLKCPMFHNGTCWGTRDREKCSCEGFKQFCTYHPKGE